MTRFDLRLIRHRLPQQMNRLDLSYPREVATVAVVELVVDSKTRT